MLRLFILASLGAIIGAISINSNFVDKPHNLGWLFGLNSEATTKSEEGRTICDSKECKMIAQVMKESMDDSVNPCDNFYDYACGKWAKNNAPPEDESSWNLWTILQKNINKQVDAVLRFEPKHNDTYTMKLAKKWYKACVDEERIEDFGLEPLISTLWRFGGWPLIMEDGEWDHRVYKWQTVDDHFARLTGTNALHSIKLAGNPLDKSSITIGIDVPKLPPKSWTPSIDNDDDDDYDYSGEEDDNSGDASPEGGEYYYEDSEYDEDDDEDEEEDDDSDSDLDCDDDDSDYDSDYDYRVKGKKATKRNMHKKVGQSKTKIKRNKIFKKGGNESKTKVKKQRIFKKEGNDKKTKVKKQRIFRKVDHKKTMKTRVKRRAVKINHHINKQRKGKKIFEHKLGHHLGRTKVKVSKSNKKIFTIPTKQSVETNNTRNDQKDENNKSNDSDDKGTEENESKDSGMENDDDNSDEQDDGSDNKQGESNSGMDTDEDDDEDESDDDDDQDESDDDDDEDESDDDDDEDESNDDDDDEEDDDDDDDSSDWDDDDSEENDSDDDDSEDDEDTEENESNDDGEEEEPPQEYIEKYTKFIMQVALHLAEARGTEVPTDKLINDIADMIKFQTELAKITKLKARPAESSLYEFQDEYDSLMPTTSNGYVNWIKKLQSLFTQVGVEVEEYWEVAIVSPRYLIELASLLDNTPSETIVNYVHWNFISRILTATTKAMQKVYSEWDDSEKAKDRAEDCRDQVQLTDIVGYEYAMNYFPNEVAETASYMIDDIQKEVEYQIKKCTWLNDKMKHFVLDKLMDMQKIIGYPDWYRNETAVKNYYRGLTFSRTYYENVLTYMRYKQFSELRLLAEDDDTPLLFIDPRTLNAFFYPLGNFITVTAGDLQSPFFDSKRPWYLNFGIIGFIMGHEVNHGFDSSGRLYDRKGHQMKWLSAMAKAYNKRAECFVNQFNKYSLSASSNTTVEGYGAQTIDENIADTMGLETVYRAYKRREIECGKPDPGLPGFEEYSNDQLFFLSFAHLWCESTETSVEEAKTDSHSTFRLRVIGTISNSKQFAEAYNCPAGSPMNPENKCNIWN